MNIVEVRVRIHHIAAGLVTISPAVVNTNKKQIPLALIHSIDFGHLSEPVARIQLDSPIAEYYNLVRTDDVGTMAAIPSTEGASDISELGRIRRGRDADGSITARLRPTPTPEPKREPDAAAATQNGESATRPEPEPGLADEERTMLQRILQRFPNATKPLSEQLKEVNLG